MLFVSQENQILARENAGKLGYPTLFSCTYSLIACIFCATGEYEYIDVMIEKERLIIDVDFRSEFEIARSTKAYNAILQNLPYIFVGKCDRLQRIVAVVSEAAKQSLKKKGMHVPPWRRVEYVRAKWLSPYTRIGSKEENKEKEQLLKEGNSVDSGEEKKEEVKVEIQLKPPPEMKPKGSLSGLAAVFDDDKT